MVLRAASQIFQVPWQVGLTFLIWNSGSEISLVEVGGILEGFWGTHFERRYWTKRERVLSLPTCFLPSLLSRHAQMFDVLEGFARKPSSSVASSRLPACSPFKIQVTAVVSQFRAQWKSSPERVANEAMGGREGTVLSNTTDSLTFAWGDSALLFSFNRGKLPLVNSCAFKRHLGHGIPARVSCCNMQNMHLTRS